MAHRMLSRCSSCPTLAAFADATRVGRRRQVVVLDRPDRLSGDAGDDQLGRQRRIRSENQQGRHGNPVCAQSYRDLATNVLQSHIHFGRPGLTGGIVLFLCTNLAPPPAGVPLPPACPQAPARRRHRHRHRHVDRSQPDRSQRGQRLLLPTQGIDPGAAGFAEIVAGDPQRGRLRERAYDRRCRAAKFAARSVRRTITETATTTTTIDALRP